MDRNTAHDALHTAAGTSASCPVCSGTLTTDEQIIEQAQALEGKPPVPPDAGVTAPDPASQPSTEPVEASEKPKRFISVMTDVMSFSDGQSVPNRIKIIPTGKFNTPKYGELEITKAHLLDMEKNFRSDVRANSSLAGLPIDVEHGETQYRDAAAGWMKDLNVFDDGLYADVEWTSLGKDLLEKGLYKFFSPEFVFDYMSNEQSVLFTNVATGGGLVNKPLFDKSLPPIMFSEDGNVKKLTNEYSTHTLVISNQTSAAMPTSDQTTTVLEASEKEDKPMDLQTILTKEKSARSSEEQVFVAAHLNELSDEQKVNEGFAVVAPEVKEEVREEAPAAPVVTASEQPANTISAAEVEGLKVRLAAAEEAAQKGTLAFAELQESKKQLEKISVTEEVKKYSFSEKGGKIAPAQVEPIVDLMLSMNDGQRSAFKAIIDAMPDRKMFGEVGSDVDPTKSQAADVLQARIKELQAEGMQYSEASRKAVAENPDLYKESLQPAVTN